MRKTTSGFTIVEVLTVITIIALLAAASLFTYRGVTDRANETLVKADLQFSIKKVLLYQARFEKLPTSTELAAAIANSREYKLKVSKLSVYKYLGYCTGGPETKEVIITAGMSKKRQFYYSTLTNKVVDVSATYDTPSSFGTEYKCWDFLQNTTIPGEFRSMIHMDGGVETGYVDVEAQ